MNDTPETDALVGDQHCACIPYDESCGQLAQLARKLERERDIMRNALQRISDCDWVITLPDRMDGVRKIARDALEAAK